MTWSSLTADAHRYLSPAAPADAARNRGILEVLTQYPDAAHRHSDAPGHLTASAVLVDPATRTTLLTLHPKFGRWMQLGGHLELTDTSLFGAALREAREESGINEIELDPVPLDWGVFPNLPCPPGSRKAHYDLRFLALTTASTTPAISDESLELAWWPLTALPENCDDDLRLMARQALERL